MKKPEEIKKGLECCSVEAMHCGPEDPKCAYDCGSEECIRNLMHDALTLIQQLEAEKAELVQKVQQLERERDAAVSELPHNCWNCIYHLNEPIEETDDYGRTIHRYCDADVCYPDEENSSWEWRGPCKENGGVVK